MKINDDVIASIDENLVDVSSGWLWSTADVYSPDYTSILEQPISVESSTLNELRYLSSATDIVIRETYNNNSLILWAGYVDLIEDPQQIVPNHNDLLNLQGGSSTLSEYYHLSATTYGYVNSLSANAQTQLTNLSATKVDKSIIISAGTGLTGGGSLSANVTISMPTVGTPGTYTKVTTDAYGRVTSGTTLTSADIPQLPATKIGSGNISNTEFEYLDGVSANIQNQLTNLSAADSLKALKTTTITAGPGLTGGGDLSTNRTISLATTGTPGTYTKVVTNAYGQVTSGGTLTSGDIPQLPATKIGSGNISNTEFEYLDGVSANIQTQLNTKSSSSSLTAYQLRSEKGTSLGYAALDTNSKIYTSSIPDAILGQLKYGGSWNANTNIPALSSAPSMSGTFLIVNVSGTTRPIGLNPNTSASLWPDGNVEWKVGDWIVSDGTYYDKVDNTDAIYSWNGRLGAIVPAAGDYTATQITNTASGGITATTVQAAINELDSEKVPKTTTITAGTGLTGGGNLTTNRTISLATTGTSGTYTKVTTDAYGRVTAGTQQTSADIPQLPATKIGSGNISNAEFEYLDGVSANIQNQLNSKQSTLSNPITGVGSNTQISYWTGVNSQSGDNGFYIAKDTNNRTYRMNLGGGSIQASEIRMYAPASGSPAISLLIDNTQRFQQWATPGGSWVTRFYDTSGTGGYYPIWADPTKITLGTGGTIPVYVPNRAISNSDLACVKALGITRDGASKWTLTNNEESWGASGWTDLGGNLIISFLQGDGVWTNKYTFSRNSGLTVNSLSGTDNRLLFANPSGNIYAEPGATTMIRRTGYVAVRNTSRLAGESYEFWDSGASWADISCGTVRLTSLTPSTVPVLDASKSLVSSNITSAELNYLDGTSANIQTQINNISPARIANSAEYFNTNSTNTMYSSATFSDILYQGSFGRFDVKSRIFFYDNPGQTSATVVCNGTSATFVIPLTATQSFIDLDFSVVNNPTFGNTITPIRCVTSVVNQCMQPNIFFPWGNNTTKPIYFWVRTTNSTTSSFYTTQINAA